MWRELVDFFYHQYTAVILFPASAYIHMNVVCGKKLQYLLNRLRRVNRSVYIGNRSPFLALIRYLREVAGMVNLISGLNVSNTRVETFLITGIENTRSPHILRCSCNAPPASSVVFIYSVILHISPVFSWSSVAYRSPMHVCTICSMQT